MTRASALFVLAFGAAALAFAPAVLQAQQKTPAVKAGKGEKVCRVKMQGERRDQELGVQEGRAVLRLARDQLRQVRQRTITCL